MGEGDDGETLFRQHCPTGTHLSARDIKLITKFKKGTKPRNSNKWILQTGLN